MTTVPSPSFFDRRDHSQSSPSPAVERRQFTNSHAELSPEAKELAQAIDRYKIERRRRFIDFEEMLGVVKALGYRK